MRLLTAVAASVVGTGALILAWNTGDRPAGTETASPGLAQSSPLAVPPTHPGPSSTAPPTSSKGPVNPTPGPATTNRRITGTTISTRYGPVQVAVDLSGTTISDVVALQLTNSNRTSVSISASAAPILRQEALQAQSAQIDLVSGATYTSQGYQQSLQAALDAAHS